MEIYGAAVTDKLDNNRNILGRRYYRQHCTLEFGSYSKDLSAINNDLSRIFILDNSPVAYRSFPLNAIPSQWTLDRSDFTLSISFLVLVKSWFFDAKDTCLLSLLPFLDALRFCRDVRSVLAMNLHAHQNLTVSTSNSFTTQVVPSSA
jgi:CTD nuclear envelope phosphatase 1